jgi:hypothetical protein
MMSRGEISYNDSITFTFAGDLPPKDPRLKISKYHSWYMSNAASMEYCPVLEDSPPKGLNHQFKGGSGVVKNGDTVLIMVAESVPVPYSYLGAYTDTYLYYYKTPSSDNQKWAINIYGNAATLSDGAIVSFRNIAYSNQYILGDIVEFLFIL